MKKIFKIILKIFLSIFIIVIIFISYILINYKIKEKQRGLLVKKLNTISLEENALQKFKEILPEIQKNPSVDSAWIYEPRLYIKFKFGMQQSW